MNLAASPVPPAAGAAFARPTAWWQHAWLQAAVLVLLVALAYSGTARAGFIWDDDMHVTANPAIVGPQGLREIWTTASANYFPLTTTTFWALHAVWGLNPAPFHIANVAFQALCAVLLWIVLRRLGVRGAWLGAALWALHPVQVDSAAWISELKNTQACAFFLLATWCFLRWLDGPDRRAANYAGMCVCAALAILSKASTVMLPAVLVLCWWWRTRTVRLGQLVVLSPLFLLSALASGWTIWEQKYHSFALGPEWDQTFAERLVIAGNAIWFYLGKLAWPHPLMFIYPRWELRADLASLLPLFAAAAVGVALLLVRERARAALFAFAVFLVLLFPVLGFFNVYFFRYAFVADHFQHLASMAPLALAGAALATLSSRLRVFSRAAAVVVPAVVVATLAGLTWRETRTYRDATTLWRTTYERNPQAWMAATILGNDAAEQGRFDEALRLHDAALRIAPTAFEVHYNRGLALKKLGRLDEAIAHYERALQLKANFPEAEHNLATALVAANRVPEALPHYEQALRLNPRQPETHFHFAVALSASERNAEAIPHFETALRLRPDYAEAHAYLARSLHLAERRGDAFLHFQRALDLAPGDTTNRQIFATALALEAIAAVEAGRFEAALAHINRALEVQPGFADGAFYYANALVGAGQANQAIAAYEAVLQLNPNHAEAHFNLAQALDAVGRAEEARQHRDEALRLQPALRPAP